MVTNRAELRAPRNGGDLDTGATKQSTQGSAHTACPDHNHAHELPQGFCMDDWNSSSEISCLESILFVASAPLRVDDVRSQRGPGVAYPAGAW